ncbi:hypothetical protein BKA66DRAFT_476690 [Pyrenochaeta sp. MPI-SDFR-AT-0127]|nr:hypothetical protein BKA66DRAFT_476690 [Pyrenochaeta sp. MPI-SDFR-AT-0127]
MSDVDGINANAAAWIGIEMNTIVFTISTFIATAIYFLLQVLLDSFLCNFLCCVLYISNAKVPLVASMTVGNAGSTHLTCFQPSL